MNEFHKIQDERRAANDEFDRRIRELEEACPHTELTDWLVGYGFEGRCCKRCSKVIEKRPRPPYRFS